MADLVLYELIIMDTSSIYDMFNEFCFVLQGYFSIRPQHLEIRTKKLKPSDKN